MPVLVECSVGSIMSLKSLHITSGVVFIWAYFVPQFFCRTYVVRYFVHKYLLESGDGYPDG